MKETEVILQANICGACGNVWFTQHFKVEGEPQTCPFCNRNMLSSPKAIDLMESNEMDNLLNVPEEIQALMDEKTKGPLLEKRCSFCSNIVFIAKDDVVGAKHCPYCSDKLIAWSETPQHSGLEDAQEGEHDEYTILDDLKGLPVIVAFKDNRKGIFRLLPKAPLLITGVYLGLCPISKMIRIQLEDKITVRWYELLEIQSITEIIQTESEKD